MLTVENDKEIVRKLADFAKVEPRDIQVVTEREYGPNNKVDMKRKQGYIRGSEHFVYHNSKGQEVHVPITRLEDPKPVVSAK